MPSMSTTFTFTTGSVIDSNQMNTNFNDVKAAFNANAVQVDGTVQATTASLGTGIVTNAKLADSSVTQSKIADVNVTTAKIADFAVTNAKIADSTIAFSKMSDRTAWANHSFTSYNAGPTVDPSPSFTQIRYKIIDKTCFVKGVLYAYHSIDMVTQLNGLPVPAAAGTAGFWSAGTAFVRDANGSTFVQYPMWVDASNNRFNLVYTSAAFQNMYVRWYYDLVYEVA